MELHAAASEGAIRSPGGGGGWWIPFVLGQGVGEMFACSPRVNEPCFGVECCARVL